MERGDRYRGSRLSGPVKAEVIIAMAEGAACVLAETDVQELKQLIEGKKLDSSQEAVAAKLHKELADSLEKLHEARREIEKANEKARQARKVVAKNQNAVEKFIISALSEGDYSDNKKKAVEELIKSDLPEMSRRDKLDFLEKGRRDRRDFLE